MANKYDVWSEMGPYGSVGAHIKTGRSPMAQDHFKTPPDPKKGHEMTKNPQKSKKSSRVGQEYSGPLGRSKGPCDVFDPWVRWERGQVGI